MPLEHRTRAELPAIFGLVRSCWIYGSSRRRRRTMDRLHGRFLKPGDLAFDIGAHVGDRVASFRRLGCRVVAVEPQPLLLRFLRLRYGRDRRIAIEAAAVGADGGKAPLFINRANPTVSTLSSAFITRAGDASGWKPERWSERRVVSVTTLDSLIARYGVPAFTKIDVEGWEEEVLKGLSEPLFALSFEFTTLQRPVALACLRRLAALAPYRFNAAIGESQRLLHPEPLLAEACEEWLSALPDSANSGDIYACLDAERLKAE